MIGKIRQIFVTALLMLWTSSVFSQKEDSLYLPGIITLDSFILIEVRDGFNVTDFIAFTQIDSSFYEAFRNLRRINYNSSTTVRMFDQEHLNVASYGNRTYQHIENNCRWMDFPFEVSTGDFFNKKKEMEFYTARVFSYIFLYKDTICNNIVDTDNNAGTDSKLELRKEQLKTMIFNPGEPVDDIPLMKNKMEIFSDEMIPFYDYSISSQRYATGVDCYVFSIKKKEGVQKGEEVVINELTTWFDKKTMQIVSRKYSLSYFTALFDFDVSMDVKLSVVDGYLVPTFVQYNGYWDIPGRKPEIGSVQIFVW